MCICNVFFSRNQRCMAPVARLQSSCAATGEGEDRFAINTNNGVTSSYFVFQQQTKDKTIKLPSNRCRQKNIIRTTTKLHRLNNQAAQTVQTNYFTACAVSRTLTFRHTDVYEAPSTLLRKTRGWGSRVGPFATDNPAHSIHCTKQFRLRRRRTGGDGTWADASAAESGPPSEGLELPTATGSLDESAGELGIRTVNPGGLVAFAASSPVAAPW